MDIGRRLTGWSAVVEPVASRSRGRFGGRHRLRPPAHPDRLLEESTDPAERARAEVVAWCHRSSQPLWLVHGEAQAGKTRFAADIAARMTEYGWSCGWARAGQAARAVEIAVRAGEPALLLVDDAETRAEMIELLTTVASGVPDQVRVVLIARDFGEWWSRLLLRPGVAGPEQVIAGRTALSSGRAPAAPRLSLVRRGGSSAGQAHERALSILAAADPASPAMLLRLAAFVVAMPTRVGQLGPAEMRAATRDLFNDPRGYWQRLAGEVNSAGNPALRTALVAAALARAPGPREAATVLRRVPALAAGAADRLARLAVWWHGLFTAAESGPRTNPRLPGWLFERLPDRHGDSDGVTWVVAALGIDDRASGALAGLVLDVHREIRLRGDPPPAGGPPGDATTSPAGTGIGADDARAAVHAAVLDTAPIDEALAWLARDVELGSADLVALREMIDTVSLNRAGVMLVNRLVAEASTPAEEAALQLSLGTRLSQLGRWAAARQATEAALAAYRELAGQDRDRYLPELARATGNLGSCLAQIGDDESALELTTEAVALRRELVKRDRERHLPSLARALTNLCTCLSRTGRRLAAVDAAAQAVAVYRELAELVPQSYGRELALAEHHWRVCHEAAEQPVAGRRPD